MPKPHVSEAEFDSTYDQYSLSVFRFALAWTDDWATAEDLTQDAFIKLWANRDRLDWTQPLLPWLLTTTRHLATDRFRRIRRLVGMPSGDLHGNGNPESDSRIRWMDLQPRLAGLSQVERTAIVLTAVVGLTSEEAANVVGTTASAVRAAVSRARANLDVK